MRPSGQNSCQKTRSRRTLNPSRTASTDPRPPPTQNPKVPNHHRLSTDSRLYRQRVPEGRYFLEKYDRETSMQQRPDMAYKRNRCGRRQTRQDRILCRSISAVTPMPTRSLVPPLTGTVEPPRLRRMAPIAATTRARPKTTAGRRVSRPCQNCTPSIQIRNCENGVNRRPRPRHLLDCPS